MKKKILISLLLTFGLLAGGCMGADGEGDQDLANIDHREPVAHEGILRLQTGVYAGLPGTHFVEKEDGSRVAVASLMVNLSNEEYLDNKVKLSGQMKEGQSGDEFLEVEKIEVLEVLSNKAGWEVYKNTDFGLQIAYKSDWQVVEENSEVLVRFVPPNENEDYVSIAKTKVKADELEGALKELNVDTDKVTVSQLGIDKLDARKLTDEEKTALSYFLYRDGYVYTIQFLGSGSSESLKNKNTFHEMLLDFRFTAFTSSDSKKADDSDSSEKEPVSSSDSDAKSSNAKILDIIQDSPGKFSSNLAAKTISRVEFLAEKYVYVEFKDGEDAHRWLYEYDFDGQKLKSVEVLAKYVPGETTDWKLLEGTNPVIGKEKTVYIIDEGEISSTVVKEGFRYFESNRYGFRLQYPANWYYAGRSDSSDQIVYHYGFSDEPVTDANVKINVDIMPQSVGQFGEARFKDLGDELQVRISSSSEHDGLADEIYETIELVK